jgi:hypothetical protein
MHVSVVRIIYRLLKKIQQANIAANVHCAKVLYDYRFVSASASLAPLTEKGVLVLLRLNFIVRATHRCVRGSRVPTSRMSNRRPQWETKVGLSLFRH